MDPTIAFCPNEHCHSRGQIGQGNIGIHSQKEQRFICHECHKTFSARTGTVLAAPEKFESKRFCSTKRSHGLYTR